MEDGMKKRLFVLFLVIILALDGSYVPNYMTGQVGASFGTVVQAKKATKVYITATGSCYHRRKCGRGTYWKVTLKEAKSRGLRPCKRCY